MLQTLFNILLIVLGFGLLIFIHELGHFLAAKWAGIRTEAFAVGMGPVMVSWRRGIGFRVGSTAPEYENRVQEEIKKHKAQSAKASLTDGDRPSPELPRAEFYRIGDRIGLGETEYSLRWLPIGGFVKMLGQEDANPNYVSDDPRSYNMRPIGKRMIVVSAGVIMNLILAVILFIIAFMIGVRFEAPVVGDVSQALPAGRAVALNAASLGVSEVGIQAGDRVKSIDGKEARTFADLQIASAMSKPGDTLDLVIERAGASEPLQFAIQPEKDPGSGLRSIGVAPGASATLASAKDDPAGVLQPLLDRSGLAKAGVQPGMTLLSVNGQDVTAYGQLTQAARTSNGQSMRTRWAMLGEDQQPKTIVEAELPTYPDFEDYLQRKTSGLSGDEGVLGFTPLTRFVRAAEGSANAGKIMPGDVLIKLAGVPYPRRSQLFETLSKHKRSNIEVVVLRNGEPVTLMCRVTGDAKLEVEIEPALDVMITAQPLMKYGRYRPDKPGEIEDVETPAARSGLFATGGTRVIEVAGRPVRSWSEWRSALREATRQAGGREGNGEGGETETGPASIAMLIEHPTPDSPREAVSLELNAGEVKSLHALAWHVDLPSYIFEPIYTVRQGSPVQAVAMGFEETHKLVLMTYLTIDRLIRGSVGVDQLRGPVGIVHIGTKIADRGFTYLIFFLAMISVNLAVINFLPLPIVDGGLFLFLLYEKFKGRPPSLAFQNAATIVGLVIIGTAFVVTFYNDVIRLLG